MTAGYVALAIVVTLVCAWSFFTAQRLNRLHIRVDSSLLSLGAALDRRAALAQALVPDAALAAALAQAVPLAPGRFDARAKRERELGAMLSNCEHPMLIDASVRVQLAQRFYNDAVTATRALRTRPLVRLLHLGGTARLPEYFELGHGEPPAL